MSNKAMNPFEIDREVEVTPAGARRLRSGHLWIFAADVRTEPEGEPPPFVRVLDHARNCLGYAFYSKSSQIRLRLLTRGGEPPSIDLFRRRVHDSIQRRSAMLAQGRACRLVFGEADQLPSIIADRYEECLALQTLSSGAEAIKPLLVELFLEALPLSGIAERNDIKTRLLEGLDERSSVLWGSIPERIRIRETESAFDVDIMRGHKTGFFLDQSENRIAAAKHARGRALDCFCNTGGFALHFARACESVMGVDASPQAIDLANHNASINGVSNVTFREANVFDFLREVERAGQRFDTVCLDPPAFAKSRSALSSARAGYKEVNLRAMKILSPDGILVTSSCSYHLSESDFLSLICDAARDSHRYVQVLEKRSQAWDHPVLASMPETHYLKCLILRLL